MALGKLVESRKGCVLLSHGGAIGDLAPFLSADFLEVLKLEPGNKQASVEIVRVEKVHHLCWILE